MADEEKNVRTTMVDAVETVKEYIDGSDWRIKANANTSYSNAGLINNSAGKLIANFWLDKVYSKEEGEAHRNGDFHIHDLDILGPYCCGHDLAKLLREGFNGVRGRISARPPKHFGSALDQMTNYIGILQAEWAGAQAFSSYDTYLAPYVFFDKYMYGKNYKDFKDSTLSFIYGLNVPNRWGQSPFSNITIDWTVPNDLKDQTPMYKDIPLFQKVYEDLTEEDKCSPGYICLMQAVRNRLSEEEAKMAKELKDEGEDDDLALLKALTYKHFQKEMNIVNKAFYECMTEGDINGLQFTFPIPTVNITEDFDWDGPNTELLFEDTAKYGHSYFQNFIGSQYQRDEEGNLTIKDPNAYSPNDVRSMCPLSLDTKVVTLKGNIMDENQLSIFCGHVDIKDLDEEKELVVAMNDNLERHPVRFKKSPVYTDLDVIKVTFRLVGLDKPTGEEVLSDETVVVKMSSNHLQPLYKDMQKPADWTTVMADKLKKGDLCPFDTVFSKKYVNSNGMVGHRLYGATHGVIEDIENIGKEPVQCIEVEDDSHMFILGCGLITHNCRLRLDKTQIRKKGGGLFGSDSQTGCYDEETEVLTANGWKHFKDVTLDDKFYTITPERKIELHKPINLFKYEFDGDMCRFRSDSIDLLVTPNHRMLLTHNSNDKFRFKEAKDCNHAFVAPLTGTWQGKYEDYYIVKAANRTGHNGKVHSDIKIPMNTWLKFLGLFISEGSVRGSKGGRSNDKYDYEVIITQRKIENISLIDDVMSKMPYKVKKYINNNTCHWAIRDKSLWEELRHLGCSYQKYIPEYVFNLHSEQLRHLFTYLVIGDGYVRKDNGHTEYYTSSVRLKNDVEHLAMLIGYGTNTRENKIKHCVLNGREIVTKHKNYSISFNIAKNRGVNGYVNEYYNGNVYCVEVPNNTLYVRRNGKTVWCGNSTGVITINAARLGYLNKGNLENLYKELDRLMDLAVSALRKKRKFVQEMMDRGLYPYTKRYINTLDTFFNTIGILGVNEMIRNFTNDEYDITDPRGKKMAEDLLDHMNERILEFQSKYDMLFNLEASPGEGCLHADTNVLTIDGPKRIADLAGQTVPVVSYSKKKADLEYKNATIFLDSITEKVYRITFDNGLAIECTSEHPFAVRLWNGRRGEAMYWSPASTLKVGDRIKSTYPLCSLRGYKKYGHRFFEHREKWAFYNGKIPKDCIIHHKDENKLNNSIDNLEMMTVLEHKRLHAKHLPKGSGFGPANHFYGKHHTPETRRKLSEIKCKVAKEDKEAILEAFNGGLYAKQISRLLNMTDQPMDYLRSLGFDPLEHAMWPKLNKPAIQYLYNKGYSDKEIADILRGHNKLQAVQDVLLEITDKNHVVVSIEVLNKQMPVYNAMVEDNENFYIGDEEHGYVLTHNTTYRFGKEDLKRFPDIIHAGTDDAPYYTNSTQLPVNYTDDAFEALDHQDSLQTKYSGGTVVHLYMSEAIESAELCKNLVRTVLTNYRLPYISITPTFSSCPIHGYISGAHEFCPYCDREILGSHSDELVPGFTCGTC